MDTEALFWSDLYFINVSTPRANWAIGLREPPGNQPRHPILLLHGWTGDESSMWVFAQRLPKDALLIAPRGLYPTPQGGYGWHPYRNKTWPELDDFRPAVDALAELLSPFYFPGATFMAKDTPRLSILGFSQGAALAFCYAILYPEQVQRVAGLSGFVPEGVSSQGADYTLQGLPVFMAHGSRDELVPVERARRAVDFFHKAGAHISYCEDDVGHKLSLSCFHSLEEFFR
jgi:phospholipase/carboxylesterase